MAKAVEEGAKEVKGVEVEVKFSALPEELGEADGIAIGMPTYHRDITRDMKRLLEEVAVRGINLKGKPGATFGSYGWSGEALGYIAAVMKDKFEMELVDKPLLVKYSPDAMALEKCRNLGRTLATKIIEKST